MMGAVMAALAGKPAPAPVGPDPMAMMNQFMEMARNMGAFKTETHPAPKSMVEMVQELKLMGVKVGENEDPMSVLGKVKNMVGMFREFTGGGGEGVSGPAERPLTEMLLDKVEPQAVTTLINMLAMKANEQSNKGNGGIPRSQPKVVNRRIAPAQPAPAPVSHAEREAADNPFADELPPVTENLEVQEPVAAEQIHQEENAEMLGYITRFKRELKEAVTNNDISKFPYITETVAKFTEDADFNIKIGEVTADKIIERVMMLDGATYADPAMKQKLVSYVNRYIEYVCTQGPYFARCPKCQDYSSFTTKAEFETAADKVCGQDFPAGACDGILEKTY
jgi:mRNA-degrading endonuclease toxin of MazEF toxin-antitoxin module